MTFVPGQVTNPVGTYKPGTSGNPGGRPAIAPHDQRVFKRKLPRNVELLNQLIENPETPPAVRLAALQYSIDKVLGRTPQAIAIMRDQPKDLSDDEMIAMLSRVRENGQEVFAVVDDDNPQTEENGQQLFVGDDSDPQGDFFG